MVRTGSLGSFQLGSASCTGDHIRSHEFPDFHCGQANPARCTQNQKGFTRLQPRPMVECDMACSVGDLKRRSVNHRHRVWQMDRAARVETAEFRKTALPSEHRHPVPRSESLNPVAK